jgi:hypothetical protein
MSTDDTGWDAVAEQRAGEDARRWADEHAPVLGTTGRNTISRAELGAFYRRQGLSRAGDVAALVFEDIAARRETGAPAAAPPLVAADPDLETGLANARNAIGQVIRKLESVLADERTTPDVRELAQAMMPDVAPWAGMPARSGSEDEGAERPCSRCEGCGQLAGTDDREPWTAWTSLPLRSSAAVLAGLVKPVPCDACGGTGRTGAGTDVHVDWHMTPDEWRQLQAVLAGELAPADSAYVQRLRADRIVTEEARS